jgi:hypothetical protein
MRVAVFVSHPRPVFRRPVIKQVFLTVVGLKKGAAWYSAFRSSAEGQN